MLNKLFTATLRDVMSSISTFPYDCTPDEQVVLAWRGALTMREAVKEIKLLPSQLRFPVMILRAEGKMPAVLYSDQIDVLAAFPGFL